MRVVRLYLRFAPCQFGDSSPGLVLLLVPSTVEFLTVCVAVLHEARAQAVNIGNVIPFEFIDSYEKIARGIRGKSQVPTRMSLLLYIVRSDDYLTLLSLVSVSRSVSSACISPRVH